MPRRTVMLIYEYETLFTRKIFAAVDALSSLAHKSTMAWHGAVNLPNKFRDANNRRHRVAVGR